jgi:hypothetical protein
LKLIGDRSTGDKKENKSNSQLKLLEFAALVAKRETKTGGFCWSW